MQAGYSHYHLNSLNMRKILIVSITGILIGILFINFLNTIKHFIQISFDLSNDDAISVILGFIVIVYIIYVLNKKNHTLV